MRHASARTLRQLSNLLEQIRERPGLKEKKLGIFYRKSKSFLHFHEDPSGCFADLKLDGDFQRFGVTTPAERKAFMATARLAVAATQKR